MTTAQSYGHGSGDTQVAHQLPERHQAGWRHVHFKRVPISAGWSTQAVMTDDAVPYNRRPTDHTPVHTADLPPTPTRDRNIPATAWVEAPQALLTLGEDLPESPVAEYKRRIGPWILWRAGPATRADAYYWVAHEDDLSRTYVLRLYPDATADGIGPSGRRYTKFRSWKEDLRDHD